ncbi:MAG: prepilin-type N-terminal cleavage/methylation domain-containing protein [Helicobacteraceae bacterium]|nr:prepilin-type N-terminal cleavage/methylation domain-containing protein [Helicobacteraceae bacterium]
MKKAFTMMELVFVIVIIGIMAVVSVMYIPRNELQQASDYLIQNLKYTKSLAQLDDRFYAMTETNPNDTSLTQSEKNKRITNEKRLVENWKLGLWQLQFHRAGTNAKNSYSIYADQGNSGTTNMFDGIPNNGDLIARDPINKTCLSGYTLTNLKECENNFSKEVKLEETYGIVIDSINSVDCTGNANSPFAIHFDNTGTPYCKAGTIAQSAPTKLTAPITIILKKGKQTATICVSKGGLIYGSNTGICNND